MRLRIQTAPPLAPLKAWFIPDVAYPNTNGPEHETEAEVPKTIADLKRTLCARVQILGNNIEGKGGTGQLGAEDVVLLLDGFELLDDMPFVQGGLEGAVRDGDLVVVGLRVKGKGNENVKDPVKGKEKENLKKENENEHDLGSSMLSGVAVGRGMADDHDALAVNVGGSGSGSGSGNKRKLPPTPTPASVPCPPQPEPAAKRLKLSPSPSTSAAPVPVPQEPHQQQESTASNSKGITSGQKHEHRREDPIGGALSHWANKFHGSPLSVPAQSQPQAQPQVQPSRAAEPPAASPPKADAVSEQSKRNRAWRKMHGYWHPPYGSQNSVSNKVASSESNGRVLRSSGCIRVRTPPAAGVEQSSGSSSSESE